jgi:glyoxylase-like metal-dependent hydrolase (beta-lactamase superfamily II)
MVVNSTGKVINDLYMLGTPVMPVYLMDGDTPAIFDAGLAFLGDLYARAIKKILGPRPLEYCFLTHSHFDHCGSVSVLKDHFPSLKVVASEKAKRVLVRPNAIELIRNLTQAAQEMSKHMGIDLDRFASFQPFEVDRTLRDGESIELSKNIKVCAFETPGHTWDCLSYYIPQKKVLMCSEAAGVPDQTGYIISDFLVDYDRYVESMRRLNELDFNVLCLGHRFAYIGHDAKTYIPKSMTDCRQSLELVETCFVEEAGDLQNVIKRVKKHEYDDKKGLKQLEAAYVLNLEARVKVIQKRMQNNVN